MQRDARVSHGVLMLPALMFMRLESVNFPTRPNAGLAPTRAPGAFVARFSRKRQRRIADCPYDRDVRDDSTASARQTRSRQWLHAIDSVRYYGAFPS